MVKTFYGSPNPKMDFVWNNEKSATLYSLANSLFMLEKMVKGGNAPIFVDIDYYCEFSQESILEVTKCLNKLILDVLCENIIFRFHKKDIENKSEYPNFPKCENICLFSGGVDSTLGILKSNDIYPEVIGLYIAHQDSGRITAKVREMQRLLQDEKNISILEFLAPKMGKDYAQLRGILYFLYASMLAHFSKSNKIIISECGATMYQPRFAPLDTVTYTTHPLVLKASKRISEIILEREIKLIIPFENFTKTEMIKLIPDDEILSKTHSCITGMWGMNCGVCYACITRIIGSVNNGLSIDYFKEKIFEKNEDKILNSILNFCLNFEFNRRLLDFWSFESIEKYRKEDLFKRICLDVFLCLKKLEDYGKLSRNYRPILREFLKERNSEVQRRETEIDRLQLSPDFEKEVLC